MGVWMWVKGGDVWEEGDWDWGFPIGKLHHHGYQGEQNLGMWLVVGGWALFGMQEPVFAGMVVDMEEGGMLGLDPQ